MIQVPLTNISALSVSFIYAFPAFQETIHSKAVERPLFISWKWRNKKDLALREYNYPVSQYAGLYVFI